MLTLVLLLTAPAALAPAGPGRPVSSGAAAITADGSRVFVLNPDSGTVSVVATANPATIAETHVGAEPRTLALSPDDSRLYVTSAATRTLTVLDAPTLSAVKTIAVGAEPYGVVPDPARRSLVYVASSALDRIEVVDVRHGRVVARIVVLHGVELFAEAPR